MQVTGRALLLLLAAAGVLRPAPAVADEGPWSWPLAGPHSVSRAFAPPATAYGAGHRGVDLPAAPGAAVRAAGAGRVSYAGLLAGRGVVVVVHGALRTTYEPVSATVAVGDEVGGGEAVGVLQTGHAGCPVAACLHWGLRRGEAYLDPVRLVERGPVRLLPAPGGPGVGAALGSGAVGPGRQPAAPPGDDARPGSSAGPAADSRSAGSASGGSAAADGSVRAPAATEPAARGPASAAPAAGWSLRGADVPLGTTAVVALVLGIGLLARPRPGPENPPASSAGSAAPPVVEPAVPDGPVAPVLALDAERLRRRTG